MNPLPPLDDPTLPVRPRTGPNLRGIVAGLLALAVLIGAAYFAWDYWNRIRPHVQASAVLSVEGGRIEWHREGGGYTSADFSANRGLSDVKDDDLRYLADLRRLKVLNFSNNYRLEDKSLAALAGLTDLEDLRLGRAYTDYVPHFTDAGLAQLRGLSRLKALDVRGSDVTDAGLALLANFPRLEVLDISQSKVTDAGLARLRPLARLRVLYLDQDEITDEGLAHLAALPNLEELYLDKTRVTDAGLGHLKGLTRLKLLRATGTGITEAGVGELLRSLPNLDVDYDNPERFGK